MSILLIMFLGWFLVARYYNFDIVIMGLLLNLIVGLFGGIVGFVVIFRMLDIRLLFGLRRRGGVMLYYGFEREYFKVRFNLTV
jgi:ABC-type antimicrobial peptide transport system permease subunit